jgi:hypothetical protein
MKTRNKAIINVCYCALMATLSCEIEDSYPYLDPSEQLGEKFALAEGDPFGLYWSTDNDIIMLGSGGVTAINVDSKEIRKASFDTSGILTTLASQETGSTLLEQYTWLHGNVLYFMNNGNLSAVDLTTMTYQFALIDSIDIQIYSSPFSQSHIAYRKYTADFEPPIFLYDIKTDKETYLTTGLPIVFSPDGKQLLFTNNGEYYTCELATKKITPLSISQSYALELIKWTPMGIISFELGSNSILVTNKTTGEKIGEWPSSGIPTVSCTSPSGDLLVTSKYVCIDGSEPATRCPYRGKMVYSIIDLINKEETEVAESTGHYVVLKAISPNQKKLALIGRDKYIYITEH